MRRVVWIGIFAVVAFGLILLARFPASWALAALPEGISCDETDGTIWTGHCAGLTWKRVPIGELSWQLHPFSLLRATLAVNVHLNRTTDFVDGDIEASRNGQDITARGLKANIRLDHAVLPQLPANITGTLQTDLSLVQIKQGRIVDLRGRIEAHDLEQRNAASVPLGSYAVSFNGADAGGALSGQLQDLGGPLAVTGTVRLTNAPGIILEGRVAARASASAQLAQQLSVLGPPDAQGARNFSIENTF